MTRGESRVKRIGKRRGGERVEERREKVMRGEEFVLSNRAQFSSENNVNICQKLLEKCNLPFTTQLLG